MNNMNTGLQYKRRMQKIIIDDLYEIFNRENLNDFSPDIIKQMITDLYKYENPSLSSNNDMQHQNIYENPLLQMHSSLPSNNVPHPQNRHRPIPSHQGQALLQSVLDMFIGGGGNASYGSGGEDNEHVLYRMTQTHENPYSPVIVALPQLYIDQMSSSVVNQGDKCVICQEEYKDDDETLKLFCNHNFHRTCITTHFQLSVYCPICRADQRLFIMH